MADSQHKPRGQSRATTNPTSPHSLTVTIGHLVGDSIKRMNEAEAAAIKAKGIHESQKIAGADPEDLVALGRSRLLDGLRAAHCRRAGAAHELIVDLPADTAEEAAIIAVHALGCLKSVGAIEVTADDGPFIQGAMDRATAGLETVMRFLVPFSGIDPQAIGITYYAIAEVDNDPLLAGDLDAELKRQWAFCNRADVPEDEDEGAALDAAALKAVAILPAHTLGGLSVKIQALIADAEDGATAHHQHLIQTTLDTIERMAPGSVIYRPNVLSDTDGAGATEEMERPA